MVFVCLHWRWEAALHVVGFTFSIAIAALSLWMLD